MRRCGLVGALIAFTWMGAGAARSAAACGGLLQPQCPPATITPASPVPPTPPNRVTLALFGDSVTQSIEIPDFVRDGMAGQIGQQLTDLGFQAGGLGFIPAAPIQFTFNSWQLVGQGPPPADGWVTVGTGRFNGEDGPNGYSAMTQTAQATATAMVPDPDVDVLYTSTNFHCPFTVTTGAQTWSIDTFAPHSAAAAEAEITLPPGDEEMTVHGPSCGELTFDGIVAHEPVSGNGVQVEVSNLGHAAHLPWTDFQPEQQEALIQQHYDISVFLWGFIAEIAATRKQQIGRYLDVMEARAELARMHGGSCVIVQPTPIAVTAAAVQTIQRLDETVARREGCIYTTALAHLWPNAAWAEQHGLLLIDDVHPTAAGYTEIARALAPVLAPLVRQHASASTVDSAG